MKLHALTIATLLLATNAAMAADSRIDKLCGVNHRDELTSLRDASSNPAGYYVASLKVQLNRGDPRIIPTNDDVFHLCTRSPATPEMDSTRAILLMNERTVKYLFVPIDERRTHQAHNVSG